MYKAYQKHALSCHFVLRMCHFNTALRPFVFNVSPKPQNTTPQTFFLTCQVLHIAQQVSAKVNARINSKSNNSKDKGQDITQRPRQKHLYLYKTKAKTKTLILI